MEKYIDSGYDKILENQLKCNKEYYFIKKRNRNSKKLEWIFKMLELIV